jgi:hypothetical protein
VLAGYPDLERENIHQALAYAAWLAQEEVHIGWTGRRERTDRPFARQGPSSSSRRTRIESARSVWGRTRLEPTGVSGRVWRE